MARRLPKYVNGFVDRHGTVYHYVRRPGGKSARLPGLPWSPEFMAAYHAALCGEAAPRAEMQIGASRTVEGTVNALITAYLDCSPRSTSPFKTLAPETQRKWRNELERFRNAHGDKRLFRTKPDGTREMLLRREKVQQLVNEKASTPAAQRNFLITLRVLFGWAVSEGRIPDDPTLGVKREKVKTTGHRTWSEGDIEQFEQAHAIGTRARLALALLLYTGQRRGDVIRMGVQHTRGGILTIDQGKTKGAEESHLEIPVHPKLAEIIDATPSGHLTFLTTEVGKPYTSGGFGNWFRGKCKEAGLTEGLSAHGLRKACARRLAEMGCTAHQIAAITGHASIAEVQRYTLAADRKRLAREAMKKMVEGEQAACRNPKKPFSRKADR
jgi:integrase